MKTIGIKSLQTNPSLLTHAFEKGEYSLITKHGTPIGIAVGFDSLILDEGLKNYLALKAFENGDLSFSQLANSLGKNKSETMLFLGSLNITFADYSLQEEEETIRLLNL